MFAARRITVPMAISLHLQCENGIFHVGWHHRFLCQWLLHGFTRIWYLQQHIYAMWMVLFLLQQVSPMDDVFLVSFGYFCGFGGENRCF